MREVIVKSADEKMLVQMTVSDLCVIVREEVAAALTAHKPKPKLTFDTKEAAEILNVPESWLANAAREGKIKSVRLGHYVRFKLEDLEKFVAANGDERI